MTAGACGHQNQPVDAHAQGFLGMANVGDVMEDQAAVAVGRLDNHRIGLTPEHRGPLQPHIKR